MAAGRRIVSLTSLLWLVLGLSLGIFAGRGFRPAPPAEPEPARKARHRNVAPAAPSTESATGSIAPSENAKSRSVLETLRRLAADKSGNSLGTCLGLIRDLAASDCREALDLFHGWPNGERQIIHRAIAARWASLDPEGTWRAISSVRNRDIANLLCLEAARELAKRDPDAALAKLSQPSPGLSEFIFTHFVITAVAENDPARAAAFLLTRRKFIQDEDLFRNVAAKWAKSNAEGAVAWATSLPEGRARSQALKAAWNIWAEKDPAAVGAIIKSSPHVRFDRSIVGSVASAWSKDNPGAAFAWIESLPAQADRDRAWSSLELDVQKLGAAATLELIKRIPTDQRGQVAARIVSEWARTDRSAALAWLERLPEGSDRNQALRPIVDEWAVSEPGQAVAYLAGLPASDAKTDLLRRVAGTWAAQDSEAAIQWLQGLPAGSERDQVASSAIKALGEVVEPARAAQFLTLLESPVQRREVVQEIAARWGRSDGAAAAQWLGQLSDADSHANAYHSLARQWAFVDQDATARWMESLPPGASRDSAIGAFVESIDGYDPALATFWAAAIENPSERDKNIRSAFERWLQRDTEAARNWLQQVQLDEGLRLALAQASEERLRKSVK